MNWPSVVSLSILIACSAAAEDRPPAPADPFDYSYCGGQPVYPVIGINFATYCGPRNQIALGRRGKLMWIFPGLDGRAAHAQGNRMLSQDELKRLSLYAEAAQFADSIPGPPGAMNYQMGIDFQGRPYKRLHAVMSDRYTPANTLFRAMLSMVPDLPLLPDCADGAVYFEPTLLPGERRSLMEPPLVGRRYDRTSR